LRVEGHAIGKKTKRGYNPAAVKKLFRFARARAIFVSGLNLRGEFVCARLPLRDPRSAGGKRNKNGNDAWDIIDRLNRRSFARLPFEK